MNHTIPYAVIAFGLSVIFSAFYWGVMRPVLLIRSQYRIYALRDALRSMAIRGEASHRSHAYQYLEDFMNKAICILPTVSVNTLLRFAVAEPSEGMVRFDEEASEELQHLREAARTESMWIILMNSPWFSTMLATGWLLRKVLSSLCRLLPSRRQLEAGTEIYASEVRGREPVKYGTHELVYCI